MASLGQALGQETPAARDEELFLESVERALAQLRSQGQASGELERATVRPEEVESGFLLLDGTGCLLTANDRASRLLELRREAAGQPLELAFAHHPQLVRELGPLCRSGQALPRGELELVRRDGSRFGIGYVVEPLRRPDGMLRGCLILIAPLEALDTRQREAHLLQTLGELGELAAGVAHELRNGLGTLSAQLELLERGRLADPELLEEARREVSQLLRVVTDFLDFARPGTALLKPIELQTFAERLARDPLFSPPGVEVNAARGLPRIRGDEVLLRRAVSNLLANAVAAHREAGKQDPVELELQLHGRHVLLSVRDRGAGLPPGDPERLFDPFRSLRPGGTGLGLALARRVAWLHGGQLVLVNHPEGGVEARLTLPVEGEGAQGNPEAFRPS
jgi:signal transduction histidine kinase